MAERLIIGMSGASGAPLTVELLRRLHDRRPEIETHLIVTKGGEMTLAQETGVTPAELQKLATVCHPNSNIGAAPASGSFKSMGMIVVPCSNDATMLEMVSETIPVVLIDRYYENTKLSYVCSDNYNGSIDAVKYLTQFGHRKILCIRGNLHATPVKDRVRGYRDAMHSASFDDSINISGNSFSVETGYLETKLALNSRENRPTAVFALSNTILLGALKAIKEANLRIPDDISLVSFDGSKYFDFLDPAITHVSQPVNEMGLLAIKILVQEIDGTGESGTHIELPVQLIVKDSVGMLRTENAPAEE